MNKRIKRVIILSIIAIIILVAIIASYFIVKNRKNQENIQNVLETYTEDTVSDRLNNDEVTSANDLMLKIDGETVLGVIKINKIDYEGLVYEGTSLDTLDKGVGHFEHSPYLNGNVCLAGHNYKNCWAKLHTLESGDLITYTSFLGSKQYKVSQVIKIAETDWSLLENNDKNILTLITCVKGKPSQRLCVQAVEVH